MKKALQNLVSSFVVVLNFIRTRTDLESSGVALLLLENVGTSSARS